MQRDPLEYRDGWNLVQAFMGNPLLYTDPFGTQNIAADKQKCYDNAEERFRWGVTFAKVSCALLVSLDCYLSVDDALKELKDKLNDANVDFPAGRDLFLEWLIKEFPKDPIFKKGLRDLGLKVLAGGSVCVGAQLLGANADLNNGKKCCDLIAKEKNAGGNPPPRTWGEWFTCFGNNHLWP